METATRMGSRSTGHAPSTGSTTRGGRTRAKPSSTRTAPSRVVDRLMKPDMWSGWGIRTLSTQHPSYNPYSYHLGSVWPHDNATIAGGFRRAGRHTEAQHVAEAIFAAAERFESYSLPELYAGIAREPGSLPVPYLGTNVPQAWSAASIFRLVAILCGIHTVGSARAVYVNRDLPEG